jgi:hypothetical protein
MFVQSVMAWVVLAAGALLMLAGLSGGRIFTQPLWTGSGALKMALFTAAYAGLALLAARFRPRLFLPALAVLAAGYSMLAVGPIAVIGALWLLAGSFATGAWILQTRLKFIAKYPQVVTLLGLAVWSVFVAFTAHWPVHRAWLYWLIFLLPMFQVFRLRLVQGALPAWSESRADSVWPALAMFPAAVHWMVALKPEVSADGLAMHLVVAARMAERHFWPFDGSGFAWAVKPMNGDWIWSIAYILGGEGAAKLMNALILVLICWLLYAWLHEMIPARLAGLLTAGFASIPLVQRVTGSLDVENVAAAFLLTAMIFYRRYLKAQKLGDALATAFLAGAAAATTLSALGIVVPLVLAALITFQGRHMVYGGLLGLAVGLHPYLTAAWRTGNPVFPYMNHYFRSPLFDMTAPLVDPRFVAVPNWRTWFDLSFHSSRFSEGGDGSFGVMFFVLAPLALVAVRRTWPRAGFAALWMCVAGGLVVFLTIPNVRHLYPALPLLTLVIGIAAATLRAYSQRLEWGISACCVAALLVQLATLPAAAPENGGFFLPQMFNRQGAEDYLARFAPERPLVDHLNASAPDARTAWMESNAISNFAGRSWTNTWHSYAFWKALRTSTAAEGHLYQTEQNQIQYFIAPSAQSARGLSSVFTREFLDLYTDPVRKFGDFELRKLAPVRRTLDALPQPYAPAGTHDELNSFVRYEGPWGRDLSFRNTYRGTLAFSNDTRSRVYIRFQGRAITLIHTAAANRCPALVSIDGADSLPFSQYSGSTRWQSRSPRFDVAPGHHTLILRFPQPRDGASSVLGCFLDLDGFVVE